MALVHSASEGRCILFSRYFGSDSEGKNIVISIKVHFPLELSAKYPLRSNIALRFRWRQITWNMYSFYNFLWKPYDKLLKYQFHGLLCNLLLAIFDFSQNFNFFCHKHLHIYSILLKNMRLSNFTSLSVLSFADKPKLAYLIRPTKRGEKRANCLQKSTQIQIWHLKAKWTLKISLYVANPSKSQPS